jgi:GDP-D-mannose dehydratase
MVACNEVLFSCDLRRWCETFVTRKVTRGRRSIVLGPESFFICVVLVRFEIEGARKIVYA